MTAPAVSFRGVTKRFPGVMALSGVSFDVHPGTCHAVCGENGAGKSTLGKILAGIQIPDEGEIQLNGNVTKFRSPREALSAGIVMVHQELAFCENLSVAENLCLNALPAVRGFVDRREMSRRASELLTTVGSRIDPARQVATLSVAEQQVVQIAHAVGQSARVIIFDEPTSSLGDADAANLHALIRALQRQGVAILYVSHRMSEIFRLSQQITVLRDGQHVTTQPTDTLAEADLIKLMIGRRMERRKTTPSPEAGLGAERMRVENFSRIGKFEDVSFALHAGEVVGLAGLVGAGRTELGQAIFGLDPLARGQLSVGGEAVQIRSPRDAVALGIAYVPEDRKRHGLVLSMTTRENATLTTLKHYARRTWVNRSLEREAVNALFGKLRVRVTRHAMVATLSGGNQQKIVLAKWLAANSEILILDEPTRGVDVAVKAEIHAWIQRLAASGVAILLISSELSELLELSHRVLVLTAGRLVGELPREEATQESVLRLMTGVGSSQPT